MKSKYRQSVFIVTYSKTSEGIKYLILKRKSHWRGWEFPKGGINFPETKSEAVKREVIEEAGKKALEIKKFKFFGKYNYKKKFPDRKDFIGQAYSLYSARIEYGKVKFDKVEHSEYVWLSFNEAEKKLTFPNQKKCLKIVNDWLEKDKIKFRERIIPESGTRLFLGKDAKNNDKLMEKFRGKENIIIHTSKPGSPFCVIDEDLKPSEKIINASGAICAGYSQDWRTNKKDVIIHVFTGKDIYKQKNMKIGTWKAKKLREKKIKKEEILKRLKQNAESK